ncbi:MAG: sensor histidine kinase [Omnitrophica WOR_2 bacterium]
MMQFIRTFFQLNNQIVFFGYGLVFFILGLAIALQSRNTSRLDLARSLKWLAAFGFAHGFNEWGDLFIPIQAAYLSGGEIKILHYLHLFLLAVSFTFLFEFGVALLKPLRQDRWIYWIPSAVLAVWLFVSYFPLAAWITDFNTWFNLSAALARYFIGFPGGLLAAYALRQHTYERIAPLNVPYIIRMLRISGILMALYAVTGGLIVPPIPYFPGNILNNVNFENFFGFPPAVIRSIIGLGLAIAMIYVLEVFDLETERTIENMEKQQILASERDRIARELHDGAIQKVYSAGLLVESAGKMVDASQPVLANRLQKAANVLNDAIQDLRTNLSELHSKPSQESLKEGLKRLAEEPRFKSLVDIKLDTDLPEVDQIPSDRINQMLSVVNEALSNAVRHARPSHIHINASQLDSHILISVEDDGIGIPKKYEAGYGLRNMRDRARMLGGDLRIDNPGGRGTRISLRVPRND